MQYITRSGYQINRISKNWPNVFLISAGDKHLLIDAGTTFFLKRMLRHLNPNPESLRSASAHHRISTSSHHHPESLRSASAHHRISTSSHHHPESLRSASAHHRISTSSHHHPESLRSASAHHRISTSSHHHPESLRSRDSAPLRLNYLILTHTHFDHCQNASALQSLYGVKIIASSAASPYTESGFTHIPQGTNLWTKALVWAGERIRLKALTYHPFKADVLVNQQMDFSDEDLNIKIISTPGHSNDSISILVDDEIALVGDTLFGLFPNSCFPPFADNLPQLFQSWQKLLDTGCQIFLPGHGRAITRDRLQQCLNRKQVS
jgi:hydroxyacylglutathione hydrolase